MARVTSLRRAPSDAGYTLREGATLRHSKTRRHFENHESSSSLSVLYDFGYLARFQTV